MCPSEPVLAENSGNVADKSAVKSPVKEQAGYDCRHVLQGKYKILYSLGEGSSGAVYAAMPIHPDAEEQEENGNTEMVAVKMVKRSAIPNDRLALDGTDPVTGQALVVPMEVYILRRLKHPNIIRLIDYQADDQYHYIITELHSVSKCPDVSAAGSGSRPVDLFECIESNGGLDEKKCITIMKQLFSALTYLKSMNVFHRDIKDENIVIDAEFRIKLIDFGSACIVVPVSRMSSQSMVTTGSHGGVGPCGNKMMRTFHGTLSYAPPEVLSGRMYDPESADIWSCGIMLHTMLYGQLMYASPQHVLANKRMKLHARGDKHGNSLLKHMWLFDSFGSRKSPHRSANSSDEIVELLESMVQVDPTKRSNISQVNCDIESICALI